MPFTRISLLRGKSPEYIKTLSDTFHQAMVEAFDVPPDDRFHIVHQCEAGELIFDRNYLSRPRSDDYVLFDVTIGKPRNAQTKQAFYRLAVELLGRSLQLPPADIMIVITTAQREDWSFGDGRAQMIEQEGAGR